MENEVSKGVKGWVENVPENDPDPKEVSSGVKAFIKDNQESQGKDLGLPKDEDPARVNGILTGKSI